MKKNLQCIPSFLMVLVFSTILFSCSKSGGGDTTPPPIVNPPVAEADIAFKVEIGAVEIKYDVPIGVIGNSQAINVNVTSTLPKDGVTIDVSVKKKLDNSNVYSNNISSTSSSNAISISGLIPGVETVATVQVTSKNKSTNFASKTFVLVSK